MLLRELLYLAGNENDWSRESNMMMYNKPFFLYLEIEWGVGRGVGREEKEEEEETESEGRGRINGNYVQEVGNSLWVSWIQSPGQCTEGDILNRK